jgi:uncharacterized protein (DUF697 family)
MSLSVLKDIRKIYNGLNAHEVRDAASQQLNIGLLATSEDVYREMEDFLVPAHLDAYTRAQSLRMISRLNPAGKDTGDKDAQKDFDILLCEPGIGLPRNGYLFDSAGDSALDEALIDAIVSENQPVELALGRTFPVFRQAVAHRIIKRISRENAMLALVTALPNVIPSFIELPWAVGEFATDTAFLTMNQIRMALMMAAIYDRPVGYSEQKMSIAAIAGGAFGWRAIARELVSKIPLGGGLIPKAAIAYAGTWVVGTGLERVYRTGVGLSRLEKREAWANAITKGREVAGELRP